MSRKHFVAVARVLASQLATDASRYPAVKSIAEGLAEVFAAENPRFDRTRFLRACGVEI